MVRASVVAHPSGLAHGGYREIQNPPKRYGIIDLRELSSLCGFNRVTDFCKHCEKGARISKREIAKRWILKRAMRCATKVKLTGAVLAAKVKR
jgi:hypothetical protein